MLISVFAYTNIIHLLIDAVFLVHEMSTEPCNFYVEKVNAFFDSSVHFLICLRRKINGPVLLAYTLRPFSIDGRVYAKKFCIKGTGYFIVDFIKYI